MKLQAITANTEFYYKYLGLTPENKRTVEALITVLARQQAGLTLLKIEKNARKPKPETKGKRVQPKTTGY